jgi:hypothetical protein
MSRLKANNFVKRGGGSMQVLMDGRMTMNQEVIMYVRNHSHLLGTGMSEKLSVYCSIQVASSRSYGEFEKL